MASAFVKRLFAKKSPTISSLTRLSCQGQELVVPRSVLGSIESLPLVQEEDYLYVNESKSRVKQMIDALTNPSLEMNRIDPNLFHYYGVDLDQIQNYSALVQVLPIDPEQQKEAFLRFEYEVPAVTIRHLGGAFPITSPVTTEHYNESFKIHEDYFADQDEECFITVGTEKIGYRIRKHTTPWIEFSADSTEKLKEILLDEIDILKHPPTLFERLIKLVKKQKGIE